MNNNSLMVGIVALALGGAAGYYVARSMQCPVGTCSAGMINEQQCGLRRAMEKLWAEHGLWTRQFIVSAVAGLEDAEIAAERLLRNQDDIGNAIVPFYGADAGAELTRLLREHITITGDLVKAAIANDEAKVKSLDELWHANAAAIAEFLSKANPHLEKEMLLSMLNEHLKLITLELQHRLKKDWKNDVANYDKVFDQGVMMGKDLADGVIKQFPDKF